MLTLFLLISCGGGDGDSDSETPLDLETDSSEIRGVFMDSPVSGLEYSCGSYSEITSAEGGLRCDRNSDVIFNVGSVELGTTKMASQISPVDLVDQGTTRNKTVQNIARFLQMLDYNGDPSDGIEITSAVREVASTWSQIDFSADLSIDDYISDAASVDNTPHHLPDGDTASTHLEHSLGLNDEVDLNCSTFYPESTFCDEATFPTCDAQDIPISSIATGMSYTEVVEVLGCHGVLTSASATSEASVAIYGWGERTSYDWLISFIEEDGVATVHSATKY
jgi:hypothetical protein